MICEVCKNNAADQKHHKFSQTKWARKLYGAFLDHPLNLQMVCRDCHASHLSPDLTHWSEKEFCNALKLEPRSKTAKLYGLRS